MDFQKEIKKALKKEIGKELELEVPQNPNLGDYAIPCFILVKQYKKDPAEIAKELSDKLEIKGVEIEAIGPYLNFFIDKSTIAKDVLTEVFKNKDYGKGRVKKEKVMVEYSQANTHKAFHVGHIRGTSLGESLSRILKYQGYEVVQANYQGDTGAHVAKWLWCYLKYHKNEKPPKKDPEKWIASIYVEAVKKTNEKTQKEIDEVNFKLENNKDKKLKALWKKTRKWSLDSLDLIYDDLDAHFDRFFFEREMEKRARELSKELVKKKIAKVSEEATIMNLKRYNLGVWVLLRKDGTCLYSAKDVALAERKFKDFKIDKSIYVVGSEQSMHMQQLFKTLDLMKFKQAKKCYHLSFAEVRLSTGKMSSRTGENILYSELKEEMVKKIKEEVEKRHKTWKAERKNKAIKNVFSAAMKFEMLVQAPNRSLVFDIKKALDFEGATGPYIQYAHARCNSILKKYQHKIDDKIEFELLNEDAEVALVKLMQEFPDLVTKAAKNYKPSLVANYTLKFAQTFSDFYNLCHVITEDKELTKARILLVYCTKQVLKKGLTLLGIEAPLEM